MDANIFYDVTLLSFEKRKELLNFAKDNCITWYVDILDTETSFSRQRCEMEYNKIMAKFKKDSHFTVINRLDFSKNKRFGEIGFRTMSGIDYFLYIMLDMKTFELLIEKFELKPAWWFE